MWYKELAFQKKQHANYKKKKKKKIKNVYKNHSITQSINFGGNAFSVMQDMKHETCSTGNGFCSFYVNINLCTVFK